MTDAEHPSVKFHARYVEAARVWLTQFPKRVFRAGGKGTNALAIWEEFQDWNDDDVSYDQFIEAIKLAGFSIREGANDTHFINIVSKNIRESILNNPRPQRKDRNHA